ncbi:MAG: DeoR/GlpR transcriptional regulator [Lentisphaeria bacterium]|nr:DeoR/GlpR transcriptional regulator [Lentisphaeria bacterium]
MKERREAIRRFIEERGEVSIGELAAAFGGWSEMTIRRDLDYLSGEHSIILTRGGARYLPGRYGLSEDIYSEREQRNLPDKQRLAEKALTLFAPGKGIFIDAGTTAMVLARRLPDENMVIVTSAPNIALEIATRKARPAVVMLGGTIARNTISVSNPSVETQLSELNIDTAFMSTSGFDEAAGFSVGHQLDALLKRAVIKRARRVVMLADSSKVGALLPFTFARLEDIDALVTDDNFPEDLRKRLSGKVKIV